MADVDRRSLSDELEDLEEEIVHVRCMLSALNDNWMPGLSEAADASWVQDEEGRVLAERLEYARDRIGEVKAELDATDG